MTKNSLLSLSCIFLLHFFVFYFAKNEYSSIQVRLLLTPVLYSLFLLLVSHALLYIKQNTANFVNRFLMATSFQILGVLTFVAALVYVKHADMRPLAYILLTAFVPGMFIQGGFLIGLLRNTDPK